jgi:ATP-dependent Clp protease ATP-binding subunit ClpX
MTTISPKIIYEFLDSRVVGQDAAKKTLATAGFLHASKTLYWKKQELATKPIKGSNVLLMGPSGCGKTYLAQNLAEYLGSAYLEINARALTNEGYKGMSISDHFEALYYSKTVAERIAIPHAIVFLDEFDKICGDGGGSPGWNTSLQHSLLKIIEGTTVDFPDKKGTVDTRGMLFVIGGNFQSIREIIRKPKSIGFSNPEAPKDVSLHQELIKAGMIQEVAGRISLISEIEQLTKKDLKRALTEADRSIYQQYQDMYFEIYGKELSLSPYQIEKILQLCMEKKVGARGLQSSLDEYLSKSLFTEEIDVQFVLDDYLDYY